MQGGAAQTQLIAVGGELHRRAAERLIARGIGGCGKLDLQAFSLHWGAGKVGQLGQPAGQQ
ncbi:hypothetical protein D3C76_1664450 [compost metagenome]